MDIKTQTARLNERITFGSVNMKFLSALSILVFAMWLEEPHVQGTELSPRKINPVNAGKGAVDIIGAIKDIGGKLIGDIKANSYGRGVGRIPDKAPCPAGLRDDGLSCWSDAHIYGKGCCCTIFGCCGGCRPGYNDDGCTCRKIDFGIKLTLFDRQNCRDDEDKYGALCYPKCREGYRAYGCCVCKRINFIHS